MLAGRDLMRKLKGKEKFVVAMKLLEDPTTGKKMSKTEQALINISDEPKEMYGKVMSLPDSGIVPFFEMATRIPFAEVKHIEHELEAGTLHPRDAKMRLAREITEMYHDKKKALQAEEYFVSTFSKKTVSEHTPELKVIQKSLSLLDLVVYAGIPSKSEAKRLISQRAVEIDGNTKTDEKEIIVMHTGIVLRVGKHKIFKIKHS
jgi:tyrosyl-tRNA synthetase